MILSGGFVVDGDFSLKQLDVEIQDGKISNLKMGICGEEKRDVSGCYVLPGFIDTHIHGAYGTRISDSEPKLEAMCRFEATQGVTGLAITTAASAFPDLLRQLRLAAEIAEMGVQNGAKILGIHGEGPFISKNRKGAMNGDNILDPDIEKLNAMIKISRGLLKILTVAPESKGAPELIQYAVDQGITVSLGHTVATYEEALSGIRAGATQLTHIFNAMVGLNHREPGVLGAGLTNPDVVCEMICDYVHLHPAVVQMIYKLKGSDKVNIISDSGHAAGMNVTEFTVDGLTRYVKDGVVRLADGTIAGSAKTMLDGVKNLLASGIPLEEVSKMASLNPAKTLKLDAVTGSLVPGKTADIVVLDREYNLVCTYVDGVCVYDATK
ncbi:MAG: N-acetylglucosamine-6-phosphate deacetylase [Ruminococcaceae bacterium]|nr:N-acetylglucosamine-6-phosphate deacetylase [Oscillospiraceae bacterium]